MKRWLFLDDTQERHDLFDAYVKATGANIEVVHKRTVAGAVAEMCRERFDCVWLDHDLDDTDPWSTGWEVAEFIALHQDLAYRPRHVVVHSWNPTGAASMERTLADAGVSVSRVAFKA